MTMASLTAAMLTASAADSPADSPADSAAYVETPSGTIKRTQIGHKVHLLVKGRQLPALRARGVQVVMRKNTGDLCSSALSVRKVVAPPRVQKCLRLDRGTNQRFVAYALAHGVTQQSLMEKAVKTLLSKQATLGE